ncbi:hypothetical protein K440DRAFT_631662 [Wilcoxina mikolae CBS 423.85]|nr:hypothetical protein K440DRAFT_631662 [Wilcoxina mikolae CBS 423.85]
MHHGNRISNRRPISRWRTDSKRAHRIENLRVQRLRARWFYLATKARGFSIGWGPWACIAVPCISFHSIQVTQEPIAIAFEINKHSNKVILISHITERHESEFWIFRQRIDDTAADFSRRKIAGRAKSSRRD